MTNKPEINVVPTLRTVRQFSDKHPAFSQGSLRSLIFQSKPRETSRGKIPGNGMVEAGVLVDVGSRRLIHETNFFKWLFDQQNWAS